MHLQPCNRPIGTLEPAPATSLRWSGDGGQADEWEGHWCAADDAYYARRVRPGGREEWFRVADAAPRVRRRGARVIPLVPDASAPFARRVLAVGAVGARGRATMIVGTWRRRRAQTRAAGSGR